jgi:hypothetical protein
MIVVHVCVFPQLSVAVIVIVLFPNVKGVPTAGDCVFVTVPPGQVVVAFKDVVKLGTTVEFEELMV